MNDDLTKRIAALKAEIHGATKPSRPYFCITVEHDTGRVWYRHASADDPLIRASDAAAPIVAGRSEVPTPSECAATWWNVSRADALRDYRAGDIIGERGYADGRTYAKYKDGTVKRVTW